VLKVSGRDIRLFHRVITVHEKPDGKVISRFQQSDLHLTWCCLQTELLTKGEHNVVDDRGLYSPGQLWLDRKDIMGRVEGVVPYVGTVWILATGYPAVTAALVGVACLRFLVT
jgi:signal peptidase